MQGKTELNFMCNCCPKSNLLYTFIKSVHNTIRLSLQNSNRRSRYRRDRSSLPPIHQPYYAASASSPQADPCEYYKISSISKYNILLSMQFMCANSKRRQKCNSRERTTDNPNHLHTLRVITDDLSFDIRR